jgi:hypothetical protein
VVFSDVRLIVQLLRGTGYIVAMPANAAAYIANSSVVDILCAEFPRLDKWVGK